MFKINMSKRDHIIVFVISVIILSYSIWGTLSTHIHKTGWANFPSGIADWFAIAGSGILILLVFYGFYGFVRYLKNQKVEDVT